MMKKRKTILAILLSTVLTVPSMGGMYVSATALDEQMVAVEQETLEEGAEGAKRWRMNMKEKWRNTATIWNNGRKN